MKPKSILRFFLVVGSSLLAVSSANAATTLLSEDFESGIGSWQISGGTRYYKHLTTNQPADTNNYAATGTGAANLPGNASLLTIPTALDLTGYSDVTIGFSDKFLSGSTSRRAQLSYSDNGGSTWLRLGGWDSGEAGGTTNVLHSASVTLTPGTGITRTGNWDTTAGFVNEYTGTTFTNNTLFRFSFNTGNSGHHLFLDDIVITASPIPEPSSLLLGSLGIILFLRRRRN